MAYLSMHINRWTKWQPLSILTSETSPKTFSLLFVGGIFSFLIVSVCLNLYFDPYFIFRSSPFDDRLPDINLQQRFAKPLQVITRQPRVVLIGSSRVYRGFDVKDDFYNMGISSMTLVEASSYVKHVLNFTPARKIVLGLDFWMIDEVEATKEGWDKKTGTISYTLKSFSRALLRGNEAFRVFKGFIHNNHHPLTEEKWSYTGFFHTSKRSKDEVEKMLLSYVKAFQKTQIQLEMLSYLEDIIRQCKAKEVELYVYISPLHPNIKEEYKKSKNAPYFDPWKDKVASICKKANISFYDLSNILDLLRKFKF